MITTRAWSAMVVLSFLRQSAQRPPPPRSSWSAKADHPRVSFRHSQTRGWSTYADHDERSSNRSALSRPHRLFGEAHRQLGADLVVDLVRDVPRIMLGQDRLGVLDRAVEDGRAALLHPVLRVRAVADRRIDVFR